MGWPFRSGQECGPRRGGRRVRDLRDVSHRAARDDLRSRTRPPAGRHQRVVGVRRALCSARRGVGRSARDGRPPARRGSRERRAGRVIAARVDLASSSVFAVELAGLEPATSGCDPGALQPGYSPRGVAAAARRGGGEPMSGGVGVGVGTLQIVAASSPGARRAAGPGRGGSRRRRSGSRGRAARGRPSAAPRRGRPVAVVGRRVGLGRRRGRRRTCAAVRRYGVEEGGARSCAELQGRRGRAPG